MHEEDLVFGVDVNRECTISPKVGYSRSERESDGGLTSFLANTCRSWPNLNDEQDADVIWHSYIEAQENILKEIDKTSLDTSSKLEKKLEAMETYVSQLKEQNQVLLKTSSELEREARMRVTQMEARLKTSAKATKEVVLQLYEYEKIFRHVFDEKNELEKELQEMSQRHSSLKVENSFLRDQNANLRHDTQSLLQVCYQARTTGQWLLDCVTFCELTPDEVFGPVCSYSRGAQAEDTSVFSQSGRSSSCNSSYSNLVEAEQVLARKPDLELTLKEQQQQIRHLQRLREQAQLEFMERDRTIAELETQITSLNYQVDILRTECDRNRLVIGPDGALTLSSPPPLLLALPSCRTQSDEQEMNHKETCSKDLLSNCSKDDSTQTDQNETCVEKEVKVLDLQQEIRKWEDKVQAKEMLLEQLQRHLQTSITEVELKDTALHNAEQKLTSSRLDCARLREDKAQLDLEIEELRGLCDNLTENVRLREEQLEELKAQRQTWNEQKQNLMILNDEQSEKLFQNEEELALLKAQIRLHTAELSLQKITIQNLQETVMKNSKLASPPQTDNNSFEVARRTLSHSSVYDI